MKTTNRICAFFSAFLLVLAPAWADRMAVVDGSGNIVNVIIADPGFPAGNGFTLQADPNAQAIIGGTWNGSAFVAPAAPAAAAQHYTFLQFIALFTDAEKASIVTSTDAQVKIFLLSAAGAQYIDLTDPRTKAGLDYLVSAGLLTQDRENAILGQ